MRACILGSREEQALIFICSYLRCAIIKIGNIVFTKELFLERCESVLCVFFVTLKIVLKATKLIFTLFRDWQKLKWICVERNIYPQTSWKQASIKSTLFRSQALKTSVFEAKSVKKHKIKLSTLWKTYHKTQKTLRNPQMWKT